MAYKTFLNEIPFGQKGGSELLDVEFYGLLLDAVVVKEIMDVYGLRLPDPPGPSGCLSENLDRVILLVPDDFRKVDKVQSRLDISGVGYKDIRPIRMNPFLSFFAFTLEALRISALRPFSSRILFSLSVRSLVSV